MQYNNAVLFLTLYFGTTTTVVIVIIYVFI